MTSQCETCADAIQRVANEAADALRAALTEAGVEQTEGIWERGALIAQRQDWEREAVRDV